MNVPRRHCPCEVVRNVCGGPVALEGVLAAVAWLRAERKALGIGTPEAPEPEDPRRRFMIPGDRMSFDARRAVRHLTKAERAWTGVTVATRGRKRCCQCSKAEHRIDASLYEAAKRLGRTVPVLCLDCLMERVAPYVRANNIVRVEDKEPCTQEEEHRQAEAFVQMIIDG